ncbi:MAG: eukaryotic-like serine/threonine-protein kinase [Actinoplanes sp.]|jgi:serine/threonine-protein kinase|nr:eukaryotic-like serine/threonine-protein kinase [Actinoplanes sp.]
MGWAPGSAKQDIDRVGGRYRLVERLGTGGMSVVWRGYDEILGRHIAVKVLAPQLAGDKSFRDRLRQEALAAARLCHPHITGIFDFGESPLAVGLSVPYLVMELNDGESLSVRLARLGPLTWHDAVVIGAEVASALATAHARGIVHRDVTPANVMLTSTGAKVVDFGISALVGQRDAAPDGSLLGTPAYLAPERLTGGAVSPATDVYALGLLLYRALTARFPWPAGTTTEALRAHLCAEPAPLPPIDGMPAEISALVLHCLAKQPSGRPGAAEIAHLLAALVGMQVVISPLDSDFTTTSPPGTFTGSRTTEPVVVARPPRARSRSLTGAAARYLGLPGEAAALRLRAGLKIGSALHLGAARALGGGLFAAVHRPAFGPARSWRHRIQAAAATVILLVTVGVSWSAAREPVDAVPAQAAAAGAGPVIVTRHSGCRVRYQIRADDGQTFEALLTVLNTGERALARWRLEFVYPGTQRLINLPKTVGQNGRKVRLGPIADRRLRPGKTAVVTLRGSYREANPLPLAFDLNGHACLVEIFGQTAIVSAEVADESAVTSPTRKKASADGRRKPTHH